MIQDKVIRVSRVLEQTGMSRSTIDRLEKAGQFPKRVQITRRAIGWYEDEVLTWVDNLKKNKNKLGAGRKDKGRNL